MRHTVSHPDPTFAGVVVGITFEAGTAGVDTNAPGGLAAYSYFQRAQYGLAPEQEPPAAAEDPQTPVDGDPFDPAAHNADEVLAHLAAADDDERARVIAAETAADKPRKTVLAFEAPKQGDQQ